MGPWRLPLCERIAAFQKAYDVNAQDEAKGGFRPVRCANTYTRPRSRGRTRLRFGAFFDAVALRSRLDQRRSSEGGRAGDPSPPAADSSRTAQEVGATDGPCT